jgi:hypothetical protein
MRHRRTPNRKLILKTINNQSLSVKLIQSQLKEKYEAGEIERVPRLNQLYRTISDLRKAGYIVGVKGFGAQYYSKRAV